MQAMDSAHGNRHTIPEKPGTIVHCSVEDGLRDIGDGSIYDHENIARGKLVQLWVMLKRGSDHAGITRLVITIVRHLNTVQSWSYSARPSSRSEIVAAEVARSWWFMLPLRHCARQDFHNLGRRS